MKFTLKSKDMFSRLVLNNTETAKAIAKTAQWKGNEELHAEIKVNGVVVPAENLEKLLHQMWEQAKVDTGKEAFEKAVEEKAKQILSEQTTKIFDMMNILQDKLEFVNSEIDYPWNK